MLELREVSRFLGRDPVLINASLEFPTEFPAAVLGLSAAQREGFLRLLAGADRPQSGAVRLDGEDIDRVRRRRNRIVRVAPLKPSGRKVGQLIGREVARRAGLEKADGARIRDLNTEQRLRLAIAAALSLRPALVLLDSPTTAAPGLTADLAAMLSEAPAVVVLAAATAEEALAVGGLTLVLDRGKVVQFAPTAEVFGRPANLTVAVATSHPVLNMLAMAVRDGQGALSDGSTFQPPEGVFLPADGSCTLGFRPLDASLERRGADCVRFVVRSAGAETISGGLFLRVRFAGASWLTPSASPPPADGMVLNLFVDRSRLMTFDADGKATGSNA